VHELYTAIRACDDDPSVRAVLLTGAGKAFCGGGDLKSFAEQGEHIGEHLRAVTTDLHNMISRIVRMPKPVIAAVNGVAAGGGLALACACDLRIAAESARFTMAYTRAGLTPDGSSSYFLPRIVGLGRALDLTLTNRVLTSAQAEAWGIVSRVVPDAELMSQAAALATEMAAGATTALGQAKRLLWTAWTAELESQMARESESIARVVSGAQAQEGIAAFVEKRAPRFHN
ncbi:MAG: enoyl-CoA hydratase/isomerase family protein, partial [Ktedonobacterales bacterium]